MNPGDYSSPAEARARRRGGRGFYRDRDMPYRERTGPRHESRDRHRNPERRAAAALGRELADLAERFPRFRAPLNRTRNHVLVQARSEDWKRGAVLQCLSVEPVAIEEIIEDTSLDRQSISQALASLAEQGEAAMCDRNGGRVLIRRDNKPAGKVYWRRAGGR